MSVVKFEGNSICLLRFKIQYYCPIFGFEVEEIANKFYVNVIVFQTFHFLENLVLLGPQRSENEQEAPIVDPWSIPYLEI